MTSNLLLNIYEYDAFGMVRSEIPSGDTLNKDKFVG